MQITFYKSSNPNIIVSHHNGRGASHSRHLVGVKQTMEHCTIKSPSAKNRLGQRSNTLTKMYTITLPDKVNLAWYTALRQKLAGMNLLCLKHSIKVVDTTEHLQLGYSKLLAEQGLQYTIFNLQPNAINFVTSLGHAILALKKEAKAQTTF